MYKTAEAEGIKRGKQEVKPIFVRQKQDVETPYIVLNDLPKQKALPLVRIIVGPQHNQKRRAKEIRKLLRSRQIEVVCSETPFIPA